MMENSCLTFTKLLLFGILVLFLKTGHCAPKNNLPVTKQLNNTNDGPKNYLQIGKLDKKHSSPNKHISIRGQFDNDSIEATEKYIPVRIQNDVNDSAVSRKYNAAPRQQIESYKNINHSASVKYIPFSMQHDVNDSAISPKNVSFPRKRNESSKNIDHNATKKHAHVKRYFDNSDRYSPRRRIPIRRQEDDSNEAGGGGDSDTGDSVPDTNDSNSGNDNSGSDSGNDNSGSDSGNDNSGSDSGNDNAGSDSGSDSEGDSSQVEDSEVEDDTDSRGAEESYTKKPVWPTDTWTEIMVLFRKDVRPEKLKLNVGKEDIFRFIGKAVESTRETELELLKLKELLKKLKNRIGGGGGSDHSDVNININAASPLGINADVRDRKSSLGRDFLRDVIHSNYERSPVVAEIGDTSLSFDKGISDEMLEDEKRMFIRKGANFLRDAWFQYKMRKHHQLFERSDGNQNRTINSTLNKGNGKMLDSEKREYIRKGVAFLHKAWDQYKLKKYHHL